MERFWRLLKNWGEGRNSFHHHPEIFYLHFVPNNGLAYHTVFCCCLLDEY